MNNITLKKHLRFLRDNPVPIMPGTPEPKDGSTFGEEYTLGLFRPKMWPSYDMYIAAKEISKSRYESLLYLYEHRELLNNSEDPEIHPEVRKFKPCWDSELWMLFKEGVLSGEIDNRPIRCEACGEVTFLKLHHILQVKYYPDHKYDINNITLLCDECHKAPNGIHGKKNKKYQNIGTDKSKDIQRVQSYISNWKKNQSNLKQWMPIGRRIRNVERI